MMMLSNDLRSNDEYIDASSLHFSNIDFAMYDYESSY